MLEGLPLGGQPLPWSFSGFGNAPFLSKPRLGQPGDRFPGRKSN
jgi:hypothetical protein